MPRPPCSNNDGTIPESVKEGIFNLFGGRPMPTTPSLDTPVARQAYLESLTVTELISFLTSQLGPKELKQAQTLLTALTTCVDQKVIGISVGATALAGAVLAQNLIAYASINESEPVGV